MSVSASILITGSEVLEGRVRDSNSAFLAERLAHSGVNLVHILSCDDAVEDIVCCLKFLAARSNIIIVSGGLGPTSDDVTRQAIAQYAGKILRQEEAVLQAIEARFAARGADCPACNNQQALFPEGARILTNPSGSAPGFALHVREARDAACLIVSAPGVPSELESMFDCSIRPVLEEECKMLGAGFAMPRQKALRIFGLPESFVGQRVAAASLPQEIKISYRAAFPEIQVLFKPQAYLADQILQQSFLRAKQCIGEEFIFSESMTVPLEKALHEIFIRRAVTVAIAESCTGGLIGSLITRTPGSSKYFLGGAVTYSNDAKIKILGLAEKTLAAEGAVSFFAAKMMAQGALRLFGASIALSVTGVAGPAGGSVLKPVGTFFVGYADESSLTAYKCQHPADRERVQMFAAYTALDIARRRLLGLPVNHPERD